MSHCLSLVSPSCFWLKLMKKIIKWLFRENLAIEFVIFLFRVGCSERIWRTLILAKNLRRHVVKHWRKRLFCVGKEKGCLNLSRILRRRSVFLILAFFSFFFFKDFAKELSLAKGETRFIRGQKISVARFQGSARSLFLFFYRLWNVNRMFFMIILLPFLRNSGLFSIQKLTSDNAHSSERCKWKATEPTWELRGR